MKIFDADQVLTLSRLDLIPGAEPEPHIQFEIPKNIDFMIYITLMAGHTSNFSLKFRSIGAHHYGL